MVRNCLPFFLCLALLAQASASTPYRLVEQWTAADGLPAENVAGLAVDSEHQLWIATYDGVVRYQGFDFRHYNRASLPALPGNRFSAIFAAPGSGVIVQSENGVLGYLVNSEYQPFGQALSHVVQFNEQVWFISSESGTLWSWDPTAGPKQRDGALISAMEVDHFNQRLLLGTRDGRVLVMAANENHPRTLLEIGVAAIVGLASGPSEELLVVEERHAREYKKGHMTGAPTRTVVLERKQVYPVRAAWTERGWLVANLLSPDGAGPHLLEKSILTRLPVPQATSSGADRSPSRIELIDHLGRRWINDGLNLWRDGQIAFSAEDRIINFVVDPFDQIWLAQPTAGLRLLKQTIIEILGNGPGELADSNISLVTEHEGAVLVGGWVELSRHDPETGVWETIVQLAARDVLPDDDGLLVGTHGLCQLKQPGDCRPVADFPAPAAEVLLLYRDAAGAVWAGTDSGLFKRNRDLSWQPQPVHPATARTVLEDAAGRLLFGTNGHGVLVLDSGSLAEPIEDLIGPEQGLASSFVRSLLPVPGGGALVGTEDAGLCLLSPKLDVVSCLSPAKGLPHHSVHFMVLDDSGRLWVNNNGGIYWVKLQALLSFMTAATTATPDFYRLGRRHGLSSVEGNGGVFRAGARTPDGRIWFPNQRGLVAIRPGQNSVSQAQALTTRMRTLGQVVDEPIHLPRHARHLEVELTANALAEPENVQFRYRFGTDPDWTETGPRRNLNFRDLKPGRHSLEVSSRYVNGAWAGAPARLEFSAGYRLHEHPVFYALLLCLGLIAIASVWLAGKKRQKQLEQKVEDRSVRLTIATEQVSALADAFQRVGVQHRTALQAVSRELKSALSAAMEPLIQQSTRKRRGREVVKLRARTRTLSALLDQIDSFTDSKPSDLAQPGQGDDPHIPLNSPTASAVPTDKGVDLRALIRMEVLLHLADPDFAVDQLAKRLGVSRSALYRQVAEVTDSSPAELIRDLRLEAAADQLRDTDDQVSAIAYATGFRSVSTFSRAFTNKMGVSPRQWRRQSKQ